MHLINYLFSLSCGLIKVYSSVFCTSEGFTVKTDYETGFKVSPSWSSFGLHPRRTVSGLTR